ncbi:MAG: glycosyltransferase [Planctomycetes bacterium]|nr:glycosyltransferase [Planctomycetota bacterium]
MAICTRNHADGLSSVLGALVRQGQEALSGWTICVIDNGSSDHTAMVCESFSSQLPLRVVVEPTPGLSRARNRALAVPDWDCMVFTDDDVVLPDDWLIAWSSAFRERADFGWFGGAVDPCWPDGRPRWAREDELEVLIGPVVRHQLGTRSRSYREDDPRPIGANFGFRHETARRVGAFRVDLGHVAGTIGRGEETDWIQRAVEMGFEGWYEAKAVLAHPVPMSRLSVSYFWQLGVARGRARVRTTGSHGKPSRVRQLTQLLRGLRQACLGRGDRFRQCVANMGLEAGIRRELAARRHAEPATTHEPGSERP